MLVYRLSTDQTVPTHWFYSDSDTEGATPGFQVWSELGSVAATLDGFDRDGVYSAEEYPFLLTLEVDPSDLEDGAGEWFAITPEAVLKSTVCDSISFRNYVISFVGEEDEDYDDDTIEEFVTSNENLFVNWLQENSQEVTLVAKNTLA